MKRRPGSIVATALFGAAAFAAGGAIDSLAVSAQATDVRRPAPQVEYQAPDCAAAEAPEAPPVARTRYRSNQARDRLVWIAI